MLGRLGGCLLGFLIGSSALAQQRLVVNGVPVAGLTTELVEGTAYVRASDYAAALGATYRFDPQAGLVLEIGGRYLSLQTFADPARAAEATSALTVGGQALPGTGAVSRGGVAYLPVKSVSAALGGKTAYLSESQTVVVVMPRPTLLRVEPPNVWGSFERFVLTFDAPVRLEPFYEASLQVVRFRFLRASLADPALAEQRMPSGSRYSDAAFIPENGYLDFNLTLRAGNDYSVYSEPFGAGERVVIDVFRGEAQARELPGLTLAVTPATEPFVELVRERLVAAGLEVTLAPPRLADGRALATPLFLNVRRAPLRPGRFNLYYLADSGLAGGGPGELPTLGTPLRRTASVASLSAQGRSRLAWLSPNVAFGARAAQSLAAELEASAGLQRESVMAAPLLALSGAAGRGLLLELSPEDLENPALAEALAASVVSLLRAL
jgi:hypothetical protein